MLKLNANYRSLKTQLELKRLPITSAIESFVVRLGRSCNFSLSGETFQEKVCLSRVNNELNTMRSTLNKRLGPALASSPTSYHHHVPVRHAQYLPRAVPKDSPVDNDPLPRNDHPQVNVPVFCRTVFQNLSMLERKFPYQRNPVRRFTTYAGANQKATNDSLCENWGRFTTQEIHRVNNPLFPDVDIPRQDVAPPEFENAVKEDREKPQKLTHVDDDGRARMVDVGPKPVSHRSAVAQGRITMSQDAFHLVRVNGHKKGDVLTVAQLAGVMAAKRCDALIPLCHNIPLDHVRVSLVLDESDCSVRIEATVECWGRTGVEMEALTAVSVAALTVYDMVKRVSHEMTIGEIKLVRKSGGRSGDYQAK